MSFDQSKLDFYIEQNVNVLFRGKHGVGKTAMVKEAFEGNGLNWRYYSAATMDPWVDFVGIPKEKINEETGESYIDLVLPKGLRTDVEALFMDELNRAPKKVRNAVMELIQFKSINGINFPNLKFIWAAINPDDEEEADTSYDVEALDPAQKDRFQVIVDIPYLPNREFFERRYGEAGVGAVEWWNDLTKEQKDMVSPRRLEYAIRFHESNGDIRDILPNAELNLTKLRQRISSGSVKKRLEHLFDTTDEEARKHAFSNINFVTDAIPQIMKKDEYITAFMHHLPREQVSNLLTDKDGANVERIISKTSAPVISPILGSLLASNSVRRSVAQKIVEAAEKHNVSLSSEDTHKSAVEDSLRVVSKDHTARYNALHSVHANYNKEASFETYEDTLKLIVSVIYHSPDKSLNDNKRPFRQLSEHILGMLKESLKAYNTDVMEVWEKNKHLWYPNTDKQRLERIKNFLDMYAK